MTWWQPQDHGLVRDGQSVKYIHCLKSGGRGGFLSSRASRAIPFPLVPGALVQPTTVVALVITGLGPWILWALTGSMRSHSHPGFEQKTVDNPKFSVVSSSNTKQLQS